MEGRAGKERRGCGQKKCSRAGRDCTVCAPPRLGIDPVFVPFLGMEFRATRVGSAQVK